MGGQKTLKVVRDRDKNHLLTISQDVLYANGHLPYGEVRTDTENVRQGERKT